MVTSASERGMYSAPARDDRGGICMRLPAAKEIRVYESLVPEVAVFWSRRRYFAFCGGDVGAYWRAHAADISFCNKLCWKILTIPCNLV